MVGIPRDPGDAWVVAADGTKYWGRFGAAGLLAVDAARGVLLQHRAGWSHFGGTWGLPGGALHEGESAAVGALREAAEEAGVPEGAVRRRCTHVADREIWTYTTLIADVIVPFEPVIGDAESIELAWVPIDEVDALELHPGFALAWPSLRAALAVRPAIVVDAANVVGSVPDGWWKDRAGATARLLNRLAELSHRGVPAALLDLLGAHWFPSITAVVEGGASSVEDVPGVEVVRAGGSGDDSITEVVSARASAGDAVTVVTADRELADRVAADGARVVGPRTLLDLLAD